MKLSAQRHKRQGIIYPTASSKWHLSLVSDCIHFRANYNWVELKPSKTLLMPRLFIFREKSGQFFVNKLVPIFFSQEYNIFWNRRTLWKWKWCQWCPQIWIERSENRRKLCRQSIWQIISLTFKRAFNVILRKHYIVYNCLMFKDCYHWNSLVGMFWYQ